METIFGPMGQDGFAGDTSGASMEKRDFDGKTRQPSLGPSRSGTVGDRDVKSLDSALIRHSRRAPLKSVDKPAAKVTGRRELVDRCTPHVRRIACFATPETVA